MTRSRGTLLFAAVSRRTKRFEESPDVLALLRQSREFLDAVEDVAARVGGDVLYFVLDCSIVVWAGDDPTAPRDAIGIGRRMLDGVRTELASRKATGSAESSLCVGLARGDCVYDQEKGRIVSVMGHAWLRVLREFYDKLAGGVDAVLLDRSLKDELPLGDQKELGSGWYRVPQEIP